MTRPDGHTRFDRVVMSVGDPLRDALDVSLRGYGEIVPQAGLLGEEAGCCVIWFEDGVPQRAHHTGTGRVGSEALADIAETGPYRVQLVEIDETEPVKQGDLDPTAPAEQVVGDTALADRTARAAGATDSSDPGDDLDAVEAFLADEDKIEAIQKRAAMEARRRAEEWGLDSVEDLDQAGEAKADGRDDEQDARM